MCYKQKCKVVSLNLAHPVAVWLMLKNVCTQKNKTASLKRYDKQAVRRLHSAVISTAWSVQSAISFRCAFLINKIFLWQEYQPYWVSHCRSDTDFGFGLRLELVLGIGNAIAFQRGSTMIGFKSLDVTPSLSWSWTYTKCNHQLVATGSTSNSLLVWLCLCT